MCYNSLNIIAVSALLLLTPSCKGESKSAVGATNSNFVSDNTLNQDDSVKVTNNTSGGAMDTIFRKISAIHKVAKLEREISTRSNGTQHLSYIVRKEPSKDFGFYWIQVGVNTDVRFETLLNFHVDSSTGEVFYFDIDNYERIPLKQWESETSNETK
jgi:hypothetical protein